MIPTLWRRLSGNLLAEDVTELILHIREDGTCQLSRPKEGDPDLLLKAVMGTLIQIADDHGAEPRSFIRFVLDAVDKYARAHDVRINIGKGKNP